jgi:ribose transport system permease protein
LSSLEPVSAPLIPSAVRASLAPAMLRRWVVRIGPALGLIAIVVVFALLTDSPGRYLSSFNLRIVLSQTVITAIGAIGMTMIIISGGIDLSVGATIALTGVITALGIGARWPPSLALVAAIATGGFIGVFNGAMITMLRVVPFIVTLGTMLLVRGAAKGLADERRVEAPITWLNDLLRTAQDGRGWLLPSGIWMTAVLALVVAFTLQYTRFGRHLFAIGSSERTARLCGVRINRTKLAVYTLGAALAALSGVLQFSKLSVGDPTVAQGLELDVIAAVIIGGGSLLGGRGSVVGTIAGAAIMAVIQIGCSQQGLPNWVQQIVTGAIIVFAVGLDRWRQKTA